MLEITLNHQWSYFIYLWVIFWRSSWNILAMHSQKSETCPFILWFWCRTAPTLVTQCLLLSMVLWQEYLHQLFPSLAALPPPCHTAQTLSHLQSWAFSTQHAPPLKCSHFNLSGSFCLGPGGKSCKTQQSRFQLLTSAVLAATSFPWCLRSGEQRGCKLAGFWPGNWLLCTFLQSLLSIATSTTGSCKKNPKMCYRCLSLCNCIWKRSWQPVSALGTNSTGIWTRPFPCIHFCTGIVENSARTVLFFLNLRSSPYSGSAPFFPHQAGWHLHELMVTESKNLGRMRYQLTQVGDVLPWPCEWWEFLWTLFSSSCMFTHTTNNVFTHISTTYMLTTFFHIASHQ